MSVELSWEPVTYNARVPLGRYQMDGVDHEWELVYTDMRSDVRQPKTKVNARDAGGVCDWPCLAMAQRAAVEHHERMTLHGESPEVAARWVEEHCELLRRKAG